MANARRTPPESSVQFGDVLRAKFVCCGNSYLEERSNRFFIDRLPFRTQSAVRIFCGRKKKAHLLESAQYADTPLEKPRRTPAPLVPQDRKSRYERDRHAIAVVATVTVQQVQTSPRLDSPKSGTRRHTSAGRGCAGASSSQQFTHCWGVPGQKPHHVNVPIYGFCGRAGKDSGSPCHQLVWG